MLFERFALEVATKQVPGAELADAELLRSGGLGEGLEAPQAAAFYFQLRAPLRQT